MKNRKTTTAATLDTLYSVKGGQPTQLRGALPADPDLTVGVTEAHAALDEGHDGMEHLLALVDHLIRMQAEVR